MSLTTEQLRAVELLASGKAETTAGKAINRSRGWIQQQKKNPEFLAAIEESKARTQKALQDEISRVQREAIAAEVNDWAQKRKELRTQEWELSQVLFKKAWEMAAVDLKGTEWTAKDICRFAEVASKLARVSSESWSGDLNSAIALVRNNGYELIDTQAVSEESGDQEEDEEF